METSGDKNDIVMQRIQVSKHTEPAIISVGEEQFKKEKQWLQERCEPFQYQHAGAQRGFRVWDDPASVGLSLILQQVRSRGGLIYLSGSGADETISDYAINGRKVYDQSNCNGIFVGS